MGRVRFLIAILPLLASAQSVQQELTLGKQLATEVERNANLIADPAINAYVNRIVPKIAAYATLRTPLTIKMISGAAGYATILPGGFCYVNSRLILEAANEAELAGVIAHQIGHLALWRSTPAGGPGTIPLFFMGSAGGLCARGTPGPLGAVGLAMPMGALATNRETESKADELGLGYMEKAGYDPGALADFYERMPKPKPGSISKVFDPGVVFPESTRTQAEALRNNRTFVVTTSEFDDMQRRVAELPRPTPAPENRPSLQRAPGH
jgi:predicted Zn-dependent protease